MGGKKTNYLDQAETQLSQTMLALKYLCSQESLNRPFTHEMIFKGHALLVKYSYEGNARTKTEYRQSRIKLNRRGPLLCIDHDMIPEAMNQFLTDLNRMITFVQEAESVECPKSEEDAANAKLPRAIRVAAWAYEQIVTKICPFEEANARLGRVIIPRILMQCGLQFPISFTTEHYHQTQWYEAGSDRIIAQCILEESILYTLKSYQKTSELEEDVIFRKKQQQNL